MAPTLHMIHASSPSRAVLMTAKAIDLNLELKEVDLFNEEHLKSPYIHLNPQHSIPTLVDDDGFILWDSHAIMIYLVMKYATDDSLYPNDVKKRALINQRLFFECQVFFYTKNISRSVVLQGETFIEQKDLDGVVESYGFLDKFLGEGNWVAGDLSIADYSLLTTIDNLNQIIPIDEKKFPRVVEWLRRCKQLPEYEVNRKGLNEWMILFENKLNKTNNK